MRFPEQRFAVIVASNFVFGKAFTRARQIADLYLSKHFTDEKPDDEYVNRRRAYAIDPVLLDAYTGTYQQSSGATATITREGSRLSGLIAGLDRLALYPESDSHFFIKEADLRVVFDVEDRDHASRFTVVTETDTVTYARNGGASIEGPDLADYEGRYVSEELDVQYVVLQEGDQIWVQLPGGKNIPCTHVHDDLFRGPVFTMEFDRDGKSRVTAFRVSCDRSRNVKFRKQ